MENQYKQMPRSVRLTLQKQGINFDEVQAFACADMSSEGDLRNSYLLLMRDRLIFAVSNQSGEMAFSGISPIKYRSPEGIAETFEHTLDRLKDPKILNEVVGGLLTVEVDGTETWLCRFSGAKMRQMRRFCKVLECQIKGEDPPKEESDEAEYCPKCGQPYPEKGRAICPRCMEKKAVFRRILAYFKEYRLRIAFLLICIVLSGVLTSVLPYLTGTILYDKVLSKNEAFAVSFGAPGNFTLLLLLLVITMAAVQLIKQVIGILQGRITGYMVPGIVCRMKESVFSALQKLSIGFFTRRQTGSLMQRVNGDANDVMSFFIDGLPYLLYNIATFLFAAIIMFSMDWRLAILALFMLPPVFYVSYRLLPLFWHAHGRRSRTIRRMYSLLNDGIGGARVVKAFGQEEHENRRFSKINDKVRDAEMQIVHYGNQFDIAYAVARQVPTILIWSAGAFIILGSGGMFTYGKLLTFINYLNMMQDPMIFFSFVFRWWSSSMNAAQRVFEIIDANPEIVESKNALQVDLKGSITLKNVNFSYEPNKQVLTDISFHVKAGEMLGIVGKSGAGKSTLVNLISRLYDPDSGEVLLDGTNVKDLSFASLRGAVAMVSQETYIFMGTIAENIAYARPEATREEIVQAAAAASAHGFICRLPDGYDTIIGAGGRELSGGERQRISIARAILANPRILVLDEATASVDTETERAIQASLEKLIRDRTTISIAHRLSTLRNADRLIVIDDGKLVESGTHAELVAKRGEYYKLLQLQSKALAMRGVGD